MADRKLLGTFQGVFIPTLLTILGVIMYLRLGWVIGNAGLLGGWLVMLVAIAITATTGMALSSIATNTRIGVGGPYAIISRSLGLEVGGSVGIPLFLSQALAVTMYIFGFREGWVWLFPGHPALLVDVITFAVVLGIASVSADFAFRVQYGIAALIIGTIVLILASPAGWTSLSAPLWGEYPGTAETNFAGTDFWGVFAVFFPAVTGITAGVNMSGDLANPRRSIAVGTLSAIALSSVIYFVLAFWLANAGTQVELAGNYTFFMDNALIGWPISLGLLGATFSSALTSLLGAPRILVALARDEVIPRSQWLVQDGEPRRAMYASAVVVFGALLLRDLNIIAPLITMFFLIAYAVINIVVLIESSLGLQSYRPTWRIPRIVPLVGAVGSVFAMFIINAPASLLAVMVVAAIYGFTLRRGLTGVEDSRSGMFGAIAEWAASRATMYDEASPRAWKPNLIVPFEDPARLRGAFDLIVEMVRPEGTVKLLAVATQESVKRVTKQVKRLGREFRHEDLFTNWSVVDSGDLRTGLTAALQALRSAYFRPNTLFFELGMGDGDDDLAYVWAECVRLEVGMALVARHPAAGLGRRDDIQVWIEGDLDHPVEEVITKENLHLALLMAMRLQKAWKAKLSIYAVVPEEAARATGRGFLNGLRDLARFGNEVEDGVLVGELEDVMHDTPQSDLDILPLPPEPDVDRVRRLLAVTGSACMFFSDSGEESVVA